MKYSIISSIFLSLSLFSMEHKKVMVVTTRTDSRSKSARVADVQVTMEQYEQRHDTHESCCKIAARLLYNLPMAMICLPVVWADEALNTINEKLKVD